MKGIKVLLFASILFLGSCKGSSPLSVEGMIVQDSFGEMIPSNQLPLYADLRSFYLVDNSKETRSGVNYITLNSLLDFNKASSQIFNGRCFTQIPFFQNEEDLVFAAVSKQQNCNSQLAVKVKKYLVISSSVSGSDTLSHVVALIADKSYADVFPDFCFLHRPGFTGAAIFSTTSGVFVEARLYKDGQIAQSNPLSPEAILSENDASVTFITLYDKEPQTRSDLGGWLDAAICIGLSEPNWLVPSFCIDSYGGNVSNGGGNNSATGGGNPGNRDLTNPREMDPSIALMEPKFFVFLSSNIPDYVTLTAGNASFSSSQMSLTGVGEFAPQTLVSVSPLYTNFVTELDFNHWTGSFEGRDSDQFIFTIQSDIESTAYYEQPLPCTDTTRGITNPLINMSVASSSSWGNYLGGTFGLTRNRQKKDGTVVKKMHNGLDLYANPGTPVYAIYSGDIISLTNDSPDEDVTGSFGNEIRIQSTFDNNQVVIVQYAHLQFNNAIGINPRTGQHFKLLDHVYQGDLIGYSGRTGNAYSVPNPHLHLGVKIDGNWVDPVDFINGTINTETINLTEGRIDNIICD